MRPQSSLLIPLLAAASLSPALLHATQVPEIQRPVAKPQAVSATHTLRTIPEACVRIEGRFTGQADAPYAFALVKTHPACQPRAQWVDAAKAKPSTADGWILNDVVRVPSAACPTQHAVVHVWRRPGAVGTPALDAQGRARVYLEDAMKAGPATAKPPMFSARTAVEGRACAGK